ncbi:MAG: thiamine-phosphate kinase [Planctomycetota bacterium]
MAAGEWDQIRAIREAVAADSRVRIGIGDDTAVLNPVAGELLVTVDMLLEGVHFDFSNCTPTEVGGKAMRVNLSDIAAMAGQPLAAVVAVGIPRAAPRDLPMELFRGLKQAADEFDVALIGGDTNQSTSGLVVSVTLLGTTTRHGPLLRSGARPGDMICVTGKLGYSLSSRRHLLFTPRVREAQMLHARYELNAMMDISDGLASDLFHITDESGCGAVIEAEQLPIHEAAQDARSPLDHALNDGEDFELLFTLGAKEAARLLSDQPLAERGVFVTRIGEITTDQRVMLRGANSFQELPRGGFQHQWS